MSFELTEEGRAFLEQFFHEDDVEEIAQIMRKIAEEDFDEFIRILEQEISRAACYQYRRREARKEFWLQVLTGIGLVGTLAFLG